MSTEPKQLYDSPPCDSPRLRDFICSMGCAYEPWAETPCWGETEPHHWPPTGRGGTDIDIVAGLCHKHHRAFHDAEVGISAFIVAHGVELKRRYLSMWLEQIEKSNGEAPQPKRMQRAKKLPGTRPLSKTVNKF